MTVAVCGSLAISAGACSSLLGIEDPQPGTDGGGGNDDGPPTGADRLTLNLTSVQIAQSQRVRLRVTAVYPDGSMQDATGSATYESDNTAVATASAGQVEGGGQTGVTIINVTFGSAKAATLMVTVSSKQCRPLINEFQTGGAASSSDEWVEIVNPCVAAIDVTNWTLMYRAAGTIGPTDSTLMATLTGSIPAGDFRLIAGQDYGGQNDGRIAGGAGGSMAQGSGAIAIRMGARDVGPIADAVAYGGGTAGNPFVEANALPAMVNGRPAQRLPYDGRDHDDGAADFMLVPAGSPGTPRAPNAP
jgi:hypothetical protein